MRNGDSFGEKLSSWELIDTNLEPHLAEMPHIEPIVTELKGVITEAKSIESEQELVRGRLRDLVRRRQEVEKKGESLRRRAASHLKGTFGFTSEQLIQFGIAPRPRRTVRKNRKPTVVAPVKPQQ
jgi:stalled ribosome alternative rescue factor ArfA